MTRRSTGPTGTEDALLAVGAEGVGIAAIGDAEDLEEAGKALVADEIVKVEAAGAQERQADEIVGEGEVVEGDGRGGREGA